MFTALNQLKFSCVYSGRLANYSLRRQLFPPTHPGKECSASSIYLDLNQEKFSIPKSVTQRSFASRVRSCNNGKETAGEGRFDKILDRCPFQNKQTNLDETQNSEDNELLPEFLDALYKGLHELGPMNAQQYATNKGDAPALKPLLRN